MKNGRKQIPCAFALTAFALRAKCFLQFSDMSESKQSGRIPFNVSLFKVSKNGSKRAKIAADARHDF